MTPLAIVDVTLAGGTGTGTWRDPETIDAGSPVVVAFEWAPQFWWSMVKTPGGTVGNLTITVTPSGVTVTSSSGTDTSVVRVFAAEKPTDLVR